MSNTAGNSQGGRTPLQIRVWIDFVCPFCLLGESVIRKAIDGLDVHIEWMPFELRAYPTPTLRPEDDYLPDIWKRSVYPTAESMGIDITLPTVSPQPYTRAAFLGLQFAARHGKADEYVDAVLSAFFQNNQDIGNLQVLKNIVTELGLPADELDAAIASTEYNERHDAALRRAREMGIRAVPSVAVGHHLYAGTPGANALRAAIITSMAS